MSLLRRDPRCVSVTGMNQPAAALETPSVTGKCHRAYRARLAGAILLLASALCAVETLGAAGRLEPRARTRLVLATTTSTENSGLLDVLLPPFEERYDVVVDVIAVGTGQALQIGRTGDADVLMVHAPDLERQFVENGYGIERVPIMYNDFVILGPPDDPARIKEAQSATDAMARIARSGSLFVSRGDQSGTHLKELELWAASGVEPDPEWYREVGQGMSAVITMTDDQQVYTLSDRGTFLAHLADTDLDILFSGDEILYNPYAMILVSPSRHPHVRSELARALIDFITSSEGRALVSGFEVQEQQLFFTP